MLRYSLDHAGLLSKLRVGLIVARAARQARLLLCVMLDRGFLSIRSAISSHYLASLSQVVASVADGHRFASSREMTALH